MCTGVPRCCDNWTKRRARLSRCIPVQSVKFSTRNSAPFHENKLQFDSLGTCWSLKWTKHLRNTRLQGNTLFRLFRTEIPVLRPRMRNTNHKRFFYDNLILDPPKHKKDSCKHKQQKQKQEHVFSKKLAMLHYTTYIDRHRQCPFRNLYRDSVHTPPADEAVWKYFILCYKSRQCRRRCKPDLPTARGEPCLDPQSSLEQSHAGSLYTLTVPCTRMPQPSWQRPQPVQPSLLQVSVTMLSKVRVMISQNKWGWGCGKSDHRLQE